MVPVAMDLESAQCFRGFIGGNYRSMFVFVVAIRIRNENGLHVEHDVTRVNLA